MIARIPFSSQASREIDANYITRESPKAVAKYGMIYLRRWDGLGPAPAVSHGEVLTCGKPDAAGCE